MRFAATVKAVHSGDLGFLRCRHFYITLTGEKRLGWSPVATNGVPDWCDPHERVMIEPWVQGEPPARGVRAGRASGADVGAPCRSRVGAGRCALLARTARLRHGVMSCSGATYETATRMRGSVASMRSAERRLGAGTSMTCFDCADSSGVAQCKGPLISCRALFRRPREAAARSVSRGSDGALGRPVLARFHELFRGDWAVQHAPAPAHASNCSSEIATKSGFTAGAGLDNPAAQSFVALEARAR